MTRWIFFVITFIHFSWLNFFMASSRWMSSNVHWLLSHTFFSRELRTSTVTIFNCHSCFVYGILLKSLLDISLMRIPWSQNKTVVNAKKTVRLYLFALSLLLARLRVSLFHFNEWTISVPWIMLAKASDAFKTSEKMKGMCKNMTGPPKQGGRLTKDEKNDAAREMALEGFVWHKGEKPGGERNKPKKDPLWRGQLWSWNDAWRNIILSLVSTQFVMSFTHSFNRLENLTRRFLLCLFFSGPPWIPCQVTNPNKWRNQSTSQLAEFNWSAGFSVYLLSFLARIRRQRLCGYKECSHLLGPMAVRKIHK